MFYLAAAIPHRAADSSLKSPKFTKFDLGAPFFVVLFFGFVFGTIFGDFGLRFEAKNGSQINKNRSRNALWFPTSFRNCFF